MDSFHEIDTSINILAQRNKIAEKHYGSSKIQGIEILSYVNETIAHSLKINYYQGVCTGYRVLALHYSNIRTLAEDIRYSFENTKVTYKNKQIKITTSIGISYISIDKNKLPLFEELYYQADKALYSAKALGRNKVEFFNKNETSN